MKAIFFNSRYRIKFVVVQKGLIGRGSISFKMLIFVLALFSVHLHNLFIKSVPLNLFCCFKCNLSIGLGSPCLCIKWFIVQ